MDRKERTLRLPVSLQRFARPVAAAAVFAALATAGGCLHSNFDPSELAGIKFNHEPMPVRILDKIDPAVESPDDVFTAAAVPRPEDLRAPMGDYAVSRNDVLTISISDLQGPGIETVKQTRVSESGNISLPYIGQVRAEGLTEIELEREIVAAYRRANLIEQATVSVVVFEARGRAYSITGAVVRPNVYAIVEADYRVLDALTAAGDTSTVYNNVMYIIRRLDERPRASTTAPSNEGRMTEPGTGPTGDELAPRPRSDAGDAGFPAPQTGRREKVLNLVQDLAPAGKAQQPPANDDDRIINLDGQDVPARTGTGAGATGGQPTTGRTGTTGAAQPGTVRQPAGRPGGAGATGAAAGTGARAGAGAGRQGSGFEFNDLAPPPDVRVIRIPLDQLRKGDLRYNVVIRPRDTLYVPPAEFGTYYMGGHVVRPGAYTLQGQRVTLKQAIIAASMLDPLAFPTRTDLIRRLGPDREVWVRVDLTKLFSGRQPDVYIKADDQVLVGTHLIAPYLAALRNAFRFTYGAGFIYDKNFAYDDTVFTGGGL
jgi:polysaccharide biosynthesis/export protein